MQPVMLGGIRSIIIVAIAAAGFGGFAAVWFLDFAVVRAGWCGAETPAVCARNWISATSGWAAAVAAGCTAFFILQQLQIGKRQHQELSQREDQPNLKATEQAVNRVMAAVAMINPFVEELRRSNTEDPYGSGGAQLAKMVRDAVEYLDHPTFVALRKIDDGIVEIYHARAVDLLREAEAAALKGAKRWGDLHMPQNESARIADRTHINSAIEALYSLHTVVFDLAKNRYPERFGGTRLRHAARA